MCFCRSHRCLQTFDLERSFSRILTFIGVGCFRNSTSENVNLFDVGGKAVEAFLSLSLNSVVFEGKMNFDKSIADYADDIIRFNESVAFVSTQGLYAMCSFNFAKIILNVP